MEYSFQCAVFPEDVPYYVAHLKVVSCTMNELLIGCNNCSDMKIEGNHSHAETVFYIPAYELLYLPFRVMLKKKTQNPAVTNGMSGTASSKRLMTFRLQI